MKLSYGWYSNAGTSDGSSSQWRGEQCFAQLCCNCWCWWVSDLSTEWIPIEYLEFMCKVIRSLLTWLTVHSVTLLGYEWTMRCVGLTRTSILKIWYAVYLAWHPVFSPLGESKWIDVYKSMGLKEIRWLIMIWRIGKSWCIHWLNRWAQVDLCTTTIYWPWCTVHKAVWGLGAA